MGMSFSRYGFKTFEKGNWRKAWILKCQEKISHLKTKKFQNNQHITVGDHNKFILA